MNKRGFITSGIIGKAFPVIAFAALMLMGCGPRRAPAAQSTRSFPRVEIPSLYTDSDSRTLWLANHYWDKYLDTANTAWAADSLNGIIPLTLEQEIGTYSALLEAIPVQDGKVAVERYYSQLEAFALANPTSAVFREMIRLTRNYLNDPNSPVRNDDLYQSFAKGLAGCPFLPATERARYDWEAGMLDLNRVGSKAADLAYIDIKGKRGTLYGVEAEYTVLVFGNPDCTACLELMKHISSVPQAQVMLNLGSLKVLDIYIDDDVAGWLAKADTYPSAWINGYDCEKAINDRHLYHVRAIPSIYLLDRDKTVILKDAPEGRLLSFLHGLAATRTSSQP